LEGWRRGVLPPVEKPAGPQAMSASHRPPGTERGATENSQFLHTIPPRKQASRAIIPASARRRLARKAPASMPHPSRSPALDRRSGAVFAAGFLRVTGRILISIGPGPHRRYGRSRPWQTVQPTAFDFSRARPIQRPRSQPNPGHGAGPGADADLRPDRVRTSSIDMTMYELSDASVTSMLAAAAAKASRCG